VLAMVERVQVADLTKDDEHVAGLQLEVAGGVGDQLPVGVSDQQRHRRPVQLLQAPACQRGALGDRQFLQPQTGLAGARDIEELHHVGLTARFAIRLPLVTYGETTWVAPARYSRSADCSWAARATIRRAGLSERATMVMKTFSASESTAQISPRARPIPASRRTASSVASPMR
jgi:hypothetical protein